jgi:tRNA-Thr(GGU) m(6)t(6)A37 methyltransferase TsaA
MPLVLEPIGYVRTRYTERFRAPRQPGAWARGAEATVELEPGRNFEQALADLVGIERIWLITWFHHNRAWRPRVLPPRGPRVRRGVFATRAPHRPNPIGLSLVRLLEVRGRVLRVADADVLDGTPVLDIKPYLPAVEAFSGSAAGWIDALEADELAGDRYRVAFGPLAEAQLAWLREAHGVELRDVAERVLARDPTPHRAYRRVVAHPEAGFQLAVQSWRLRFRIAGASVVEVVRVASGYAPEVVRAAAPDTLLDDAAHREFHARWPEAGFTSGG